MKVIIAGGSGFIGSVLVDRLLAAGNHVVLLTRNPAKIAPPKNKRLLPVGWDGKTIGGWSEHLDGTGAVVNLSGENIAGGRWNNTRKKELRDSRLLPTRAIVQAISSVQHKPKVLVNASAIGYYGCPAVDSITEKNGKGDGFLAELCTQWEGEALKAEDNGVRVVLLRSGVVLDPSGGALKKMLLPFKLFAGGPLGSGKQWLSWIHRDDLVNIILHAIEKESIAHAVNATAPAPVTMDEFAKTLGAVMHRPSWMRVPSGMLKLALGEMSETVLKGCRVIPEELKNNGFVFRYNNLTNALESFFQNK
jgi:uncharacterized protein (TIGR01777 family)